MSVDKSYTQGLPRATFYSHSASVPGLIFCSGQIPAREDGSLVSGVPEGCTQCISNLKKVLESKGSSIDQIVKVNIYLKDLANFDAMNKAYEAAIPEPRPARTCIQAARLPRDAEIEIECIAAV